MKKIIYSIEKIGKIIKPILLNRGITEIFLFGSYARAEATASSDVDIYCNRGNIKTLIDLGMLEEELENALGKKVDIVFSTSTMDEFFRENILKDLIKID